MAEVMPITWRDDFIVIPRKLVKEIVTHARAESPREMCGVLIGQAMNLPDYWHPIRNVHDNPTAFYTMDSSEQLGVWTKALITGYQISAIVHSHTSKGRDAYPSRSDIEYAASPDTFYLIVSLEPRQLRAFSINHERRGGDMHLGKAVWEHKVIISHAKQGLQWCDWHARYEDSLGSYKVCGECWHVFPDPDVLLKAHHDLLRMHAGMDFSKKGVRTEPVLPRSPDSVFACPYCAHDF